MNKSEFIKALQNKTQYTAEQCAAVNDVLENHFIFRKKNKPQVIAKLAELLAVNEVQADAIYNQAMEIINAEIKTAKRHPFGQRK